MCHRKPRPQPETDTNYKFDYPSFFRLFSEQPKQKVGQDMINFDNHFKIQNNKIRWHYRKHLAATPRQSAGREAVRKHGDKLSAQRCITGTTEIDDQIDELACDGLVVEYGESLDERGDEEVGVEGAEGLEELGLRDGEGELGEGVGDVESGRERVGDQV